MAMPATRVSPRLVPPAGRPVDRAWAGPAGSGRPSGRCPADLVLAVRRAVRLGGDWQRTADRVAQRVRERLPGPETLTPAQLRGDPAGYQCHLLHAEPDGSFSIVVMVWLPGQATPVHDHVSWCVTGVLHGVEHEEIFALDADGRSLAEVRRGQNPPGTVTAFAPPGDIHRVRNGGTGVAVSLHVYGADISRLGSSIRREYDLPIRTRGH